MDLDGGRWGRLSALVRHVSAPDGARTGAGSGATWAPGLCAPGGHRSCPRMARVSWLWSSLEGDPQASGGIEHHGHRGTWTPMEQRDEASSEEFCDKGDCWDTDRLQKPVPISARQTFQAHDRSLGRSPRSHHDRLAELRHICPPGRPDLLERNRPSVRSQLAPEEFLNLTAPDRLGRTWKSGTTP